MLILGPRETVLPCSISAKRDSGREQTFLPCCSIEPQHACIRMQVTPTQMCCASSDVPSGSQPHGAAPTPHSLSCFFPSAQLVEQFVYVNLASEAEVL